MGHEVSANEIINALQMKPLDAEGGFYVETHRAPLTVELTVGLARSASTAIYYLLTDKTCSRLHRLRSDEIWHFYLGDPVEMLQLDERGHGQVIALGSDLLNGQKCQVL